MQVFLRKSFELNFKNKLTHFNALHILQLEPIKRKSIYNNIIFIIFVTGGLYLSININSNPFNKYRRIEGLLLLWRRHNLKYTREYICTYIHFPSISRFEKQTLCLKALCDTAPLKSPLEMLRFDIIFLFSYYCAEVVFYIQNTTSAQLLK